MRYLFLFLLATSLHAVTPKAVDFVDAKRFSGLWYEIARTYNSYEKDCVASTVEYKPAGALRYEVFNRCFEKEIGGDRIEYHGVANSRDKRSMRKITMTYYWFFSTDYRVVYLDENYETMIVVSEDMKQVWMMHRNPIIEEIKLNKMQHFLASYMDLSTLIYTPQDKEGRYQ